MDLGASGNNRNQETRSGKRVIQSDSTKEKRIYKGLVGYFVLEEEEKGIHHGL